MRASDPRPAPVPTKRRRLRTHGMDDAGGIRLPAGAAPAEEAPSPASPPSAEAVLIGVEAGGGSERARGTVAVCPVGGLTRAGVGLGAREEDPVTRSRRQI